ncbi:MAG: sodium:proton antiporter [Planctomycetes bacterium]|nr:sodium:proton antiporter [Planctomycetota bacterium]
MEPLSAFAFVFAVGALAQWFAWRVRLPAIVFLLAIGFLVGPVLHVFDPVGAFGPAFRPIISLAVGFILFEGGLTLRFDELRGSGKVVRNLVTVGALATWGLSVLAAVLVAGVDARVATLVGAILVLTGPTVVIPLVRHVQPRPPIGPILRWEGILIDPIGALLALLVLEVSTADAGAEHVVIGLLLTIAVGGGLGLAVGRAVAFLFERYLVPDMLHVPFTFGAVAAVFAGANALQDEAGLLAVTVMGIVLGNRRALETAHIAEWKEHLSTILVSALFLCIAAKLDLAQMTQLGWRSVAYAALLIVVVRPVAVWLSTAGSELPWRDRAFLMAMAPRGIVAAAVSAEFSLAYERTDAGGAGAIVALVFPVIVISVVFYGVAAGPIARRLRVAEPDPQGVLIVGAELLAREIAVALREQGVQVMLVDTNAANAAAARTLGLRTWHGSVLSSRFVDEADMAGIGNVLAMTPSEEVNRLALRQFAAVFGRARLYRLVGQPNSREERSGRMPGRVLFREGVTIEALRERLADGARIRSPKITEQFGPEAYAAKYGDAALPMFVVGPEARLQVVTADQPPPLRVGCTILTLALPEPAAAPVPPAGAVTPS